MQFVRKDSIPSLLCNPPPTPEILLRRDVPPARIFASRRSLRARRACSARASAAAAELSIVSVMVVIVGLLGVDDLIFGVCACVEWEVGVSVCGGFVCDVGWLRWGNVGLNELSGNLLSYRWGGGCLWDKRQGIVAAPSTEFLYCVHITGEHARPRKVRQQKTGSISVKPTASPIDSK